MQHSTLFLDLGNLRLGFMPMIVRSAAEGAQSPLHCSHAYMVMRSSNIYMLPGYIY